MTAPDLTQHDRDLLEYLAHRGAQLRDGHRAARTWQDGDDLLVKYDDGQVWRYPGPRLVDYEETNDD